MPHYVRTKASGASYFFTVVTHQRRNILTTPMCRQALRQAIRSVQHEYPFTIDAWVLMPDHLHCIWTLPANDNAFSKRWGMIKARTTKHLRSRSGYLPCVSDSRVAKREGGVWQRRFWEHLVRDQADFHRHLDYLHYNPVKHGFVKQVHQWPYSSFHRYVRRGVYEADWGGGEQPGQRDVGE